MGNRTWRVGALLCGSGFCALVYQIGWLREFRLIFGASTAASAAVVAIFIGGLGVGGWLIGPRADRHPRPLRFYALLETIVAISAALSPVLLAIARAVYLASGGSARLGMFVATVARLILSAIVLAIPTVAMGGTLPAAARAVTAIRDDRRQDLAVLYSLNTLGAVAGCLTATFMLIEIFGTRSTLWLAAAINLLVAMTARTMDRERAGEATLPAPPALPAPPVRVPFVLVASAAVGFAFFLVELVWYRLLGPLLGGSVFTFGLVLALALAGIGIGGLLYALIGRDRPVSLGAFAGTCLLEAAAVAAAFALGDRLAVLEMALLPLRADGFATQVACWTLVTSVVVVPPAVVAGYQFPLLIALLGGGREGVGRHVGLAYAANTVGAIVGSLAGGFGLLPWLSAPGAWRLVTIVLVGLGVAATLFSTQEGNAETAERKPLPASSLRSLRSLRSISWHAALAAVALALLTATGPTAVWRHSGIGAGRLTPSMLSSPNDLRAWERSVRREIVWEGDGVESSVALANAVSGYAFIVNGKSDGSARGDAGTQIMAGMLGAFGEVPPRSAMVIGLGTGSSAGWLAAIPSIDHLDVVELEPLVVDVARVCETVNHDVLQNPKVRLTIGDARETLLTTRERYDIIASEPSNPFRAGIASLFTAEYYRAANARLTDTGVFVQWIQAYEIDVRTLRTIYATLASVFPYVETWQTMQGDLVLLGARRPHAYRAAALRARIAEEPLKSALLSAWRASDIQGVLAHYLAGNAVTHVLAAVPGTEINTDDRNVVEFGLARSVGRVGQPLASEIRHLARAMGDSHPLLDTNAGIDWPAVETAWMFFSGWEDMPAGDRTVSPDELERRLALRRYYEAGDVATAREIWQRQAAMPRDPSELAMAADLEAEAGSDAALPLIAQLRAYQPGEADTVLATLRFRQSQYDEAAAALVAALTSFRTDPWPVLRFKEKALALATTIATRAPSTARRLYEAVRQPFALRSVNDQRLLAAVELATRADFAALCREPLIALEPHSPWAQSYLRMRWECYRTTGDARLATATRELQDFLAHEPQALAPR